MLRLSIRMIDGFKVLVQPEQKNETGMARNNFWPLFWYCGNYKRRFLLRKSFGVLENIKIVNPAWFTDAERDLHREQGVYIVRKVTGLKVN